MNGQKSKYTITDDDMGKKQSVCEAVCISKPELDVMLALSSENYKSQRDLAEKTGYSLGLVNRLVKRLMKEDYLDGEMQFTGRAKTIFHERKSQNAIILAAGFGMRMVPINMETPKALLEVRGEKLIERLIKQLHKAGIEEIYVVVGFMKESFEYLIDEFGVKLIVNPEYTAKNNLYSLYLASEYISNSYILPCDLWCAENPFRIKELYSWYMVGDLLTKDSTVRVNRKMELVRTAPDQPGNSMVGISYILKEDAEGIKKKIKMCCGDRQYDNSYWEVVLYQDDHMILFPRMVKSADVVEINTYEQLRELDSSSGQLRSDAVSVAAGALQVKENEITGITVLKKGMTNCSFIFDCAGKKYLMRIPEKGTEYLIDRRKEAEIYKKIKDCHICDEVIYINEENGYKITEYIEEARVCDPCSESDIRNCMKKLREFHELKITVAHEFNIWEQIEFYESLWGKEASFYQDYAQTKENIFSLRPVIEKYTECKVLTHIDAVPDNFLIISDEKGNEEIRIIDWEYAGMQDPHMDIAMFCISALYSKEQVDHLIDLYFEGRCEEAIRIKIYCYIAVCGLLWSNWCEYKRRSGVEFGEYSLCQYRYAKEYYRIVQKKQVVQDMQMKSEKQAELSELQFHVLRGLVINGGKTESEEVLSEQYGVPPKSVELCLEKMAKKGYLTEDMQITPAGERALEPYRVKNAVIMAAGMSTRFAPLSYEKPKALLKVKGELLIEREIEQLKEAGIHDIVVVVGYMKEKLFYLADKYDVKIVVNEDYYRYNNTSTLMPVADQLSNTYICSSDNYFVENPFELFVYRSYYAAVYGAGETDEYCISCDVQGRIESVTVGGKDAWYMLGHVYFDHTFSEKFAAILKREYKKQITKEHLWEDLYIRYIDELDMYIRRYDNEMIKEFDSLDELRLFDRNYLENSDSKIFRNICCILNCEESDITDIFPIKTGLTNLSFCFTCGGMKYVYRHPGVGTESYINRRGEAASMQIAKKLGVDDTYIYIDAEEGWKVSYYIENVKLLDYHDTAQVENALGILRLLHNSGEKTEYFFDIWKEIDKFRETLKRSNRLDFEDMQEMGEKIEILHQYLEGDEVKKTICHCDSYSPNFLIDQQDKMYLIDWEYSGMSDPGVDIGTFIVCSDYSMEEAKAIIKIYLKHEPSEKEMRHFMGYVAVSSFYWFVWALYQESVGKTVGEYLYIWYRYTKKYSAKALELYEAGEGKQR